LGLEPKSFKKESRGGEGNPGGGGERLRRTNGGEKKTTKRDGKFLPLEAKAGKRGRGASGPKEKKVLTCSRR